MAGECRLYMLLFCSTLYLVCNSQFLQHSQVASGLKIKSPQIKNRCKPQEDIYVWRPGKKISSTLGPKLRVSKAQQDYGDKQRQICIEVINYLELFPNNFLTG